MLIHNIAKKSKSESNPCCEQNVFFCLWSKHRWVWRLWRIYRKSLPLLYSISLLAIDPKTTKTERSSLNVNCQTISINTHSPKPLKKGTFDLNAVRFRGHVLNTKQSNLKFDKFLLQNIGANKLVLGSLNAITDTSASPLSLKLFVRIWFFWATAE